MGKKKLGGGGGGDQKGLLWRLPEVTSKELGKIGPGLGIGIGCGAGAGLGFFGGLGYGFPGLTFGFGVGAGCGVGIGFGYGLGKGLAYDENKRYSNVGKIFQEAPHLPTDTVVALFDELVINTKKLPQLTNKFTRGPQAATSASSSAKCQVSKGCPIASKQQIALLGTQPMAAPMPKS
ncbi:hypothetical protein U9M48_004326 [Paspalum notatum var. saurae]|uniref:Uncharacterized protein n=1 Tax=Paspalum notatum var. saurae TaxID=547442 RepID=A0AAQ3PMR5_PASNO